MQAFVAIFSFLYILWPGIIFFGAGAMLRKSLILKERLRTSIRNIFMAWLVWAFFLGFIYWQGHSPVLILPVNVNHLGFAFLGIFSGGVTIGWTFHHWKAYRVRLADAKTLKNLLELSPHAFEILVAKLFRAYGHQAEVAGGTSDHGVDIFVDNNHGEKWIVQCKRYRGSVGEPVLRDLFGTLQHEGAHRAYLMTTGSFTRQAVDWAEGKPIILYDGEGLVKLIRRTQKNPSKQQI